MSSVVRSFPRDARWDAQLLWPSLWGFPLKTRLLAWTQSSRARNESSPRSRCYPSARVEREKHWDDVYTKKHSSEVSWYAQHLERSLTLIRTVSRPTSAIIDVGAGSSSLVDDLLAAGYTDLSVLDVSAAALGVAQNRLGNSSETVTWIVADITRAELPPDRFEVWHDRAVFHFLTSWGDRAAYAERARRSVRAGGHLVMATFAPDGPTRCSGLETARYDGPSLAKEFLGFELLQEVRSSHVTPAGVEQRFVYSLLRRL